MTENLFSNQLFSLSEKVAVVTGASSGLGVQFAKSLAGNGANLVLLARRVEKLEEVKKTITDIGRECLTVKCDVNNEEEIKNALEQTLKTFKKVDILVNNAGTSAIAPAETMSESDWDKVLDTNLKGVFLVAKHFGEEMVKQKQGKVINTASIYGLVGNNLFPVANYHAAKFGVVGLTKALAAEWAKYNVQVNAICPGFFDSEMTHTSSDTPAFKQYIETSCPMKRIGKEGELNSTLIYLASDASSYVTGQAIAVDGGWTSI